jgi:hypothetical protein
MNNKRCNGNNIIMNKQTTCKCGGLRFISRRESVPLAHKPMSWRSLSLTKTYCDRVTELLPLVLGFTVISP